MGIKISIATKCAFWPTDPVKIIFSWGSTPDPAAGAYDAPADPLVGWGGDTPPRFPIPSTPLASRLGAFVVFPVINF